MRHARNSGCWQVVLASQYLTRLPKLLLGQFGRYIGIAEVASSEAYCVWRGVPPNEALKTFLQAVRAGLSVGR